MALRLWSRCPHVPNKRNCQLHQHFEANCCKAIVAGQVTNLAAACCEQVQQNVLSALSKCFRNVSRAESQSLPDHDTFGSFSTSHPLHSNRTCGHSERRIAARIPGHIADALISNHRSGHSRLQQRGWSSPADHAGSTCSRSRHEHHAPRDPIHCPGDHLGRLMRANPHAGLVRQSCGLGISQTSQPQPDQLHLPTCRLPFWSLGIHAMLSHLSSLFAPSVYPLVPHG